MARLACPINTSQLKIKVAEITQTMMIPFKNGISGKSWIRWFRNRHPQLVLRVPESLEMNRVRVLCPQTVARFYQNLEDLYAEHKYECSQIWNCDESGAQTNKMGKGLF